MAFKFSEMDAKARVLLVFGVIIGVSIAGFFGVRYLSGPKSTVGASRVAGAPGNLQSVPGGQLSPEYYRALAQANAQRSQQAQISGGSAVPTLVNVPGQPAQAQPTQSCTVLCPNPETPDITNDINDLVKSGKLSQKDADLLIGMAKANVPISQYEDELNELVREGKLTPEQARKLLEEYKRQHKNALINESSQTMDALIKAGQLPLDVANQLLTLQKSGITPTAYGAELNELVKEGKLTPEVAKQLLAQYQHQQEAEATKASIYDLQKLASSGAITKDVANDLANLQNKNVPVDEYAAELARLVAEGKITPAEAAKLLAEYKAKRARLGATDALNSVVQTAANSAAADVNALAQSGRISQSTASELLALQDKNVSAEQYQNALNALVKAGKLTPDEAQKLAASYNKLHAIKDEAQKLLAMQTNNASPADYADELKSAVQAGLLTPDQAASLMQDYQNMATLPNALPTVQTNLPTNSDFARLVQQTQNVQAQLPSGAPTSAQFASAAAQTSQQEQQAEQQRIQQIQAAMSSQAQSLLAAWQPPKMIHVGGTPVIEAKTTTTTTSGTQTGKPGANGQSEGATATGPLIKAGTIYFAVLETAVDSDYPDTPVLVTIVQGPFKGAKLMGKLNLAQGQDKVSLNFNLMDEDAWLKSKSVNAFAIDPDMARTVMASSVDYHYMKRYGAIMASSFLTGYSSAITQAGTSTTGIFGTSSTHPSLSPASKFAVGLGQVGTQFTNSFSNYVNTPTTVKIDSGVALGILFMSEVAS